MIHRALEPFFRRHSLLRAVIDAVLEGRGGRVVTAGATSPRAVLLDFGCYRIPGGDSASSESRDLLLQLSGPCEIVIPDDGGWRKLVAEVFGPRVRERPNQSFVPGPPLHATTRALAGEVPHGYELKPVDAGLAASIGPELTPHGVDVLGGPNVFAERGFGWALVQGDVVACAATTYAVSTRASEVAIGTHVHHRRRGLAACASSAMIQDALRRGLVPHWNASNPISQRLARRLGFEYVGLVEIQALDFPVEGGA